MNYIYSTLTCSTDYAIYTTRPGHDPIIARSIRIKGGTGVVDRQLFTPKGFVTEVSDEDLELLEKDYHFQEHIREGHITVDRRKKDIEKAVKEMKKKDASAPLVPEDYTKKKGPQPIDKDYFDKKA